MSEPKIEQPEQEEMCTCGHSYEEHYQQRGRCHGVTRAQDAHGNRWDFECECHNFDALRRGEKVVVR